MALTSPLQDMLYEHARRRRMPVSVNLELLPVCNLHCSMCYVRADMETVRSQGGLRTVDEWLELARQMRDAGVLFVLLTGGEVFLYPEFQRLYIGLYRMGFAITINTNGTLIDAQTALWLRQYPPKLVSMSLYGASNETYEAVCGQKGMFDRVDRAARLLRENYIRFEFKTMFTPLNIGDYDACKAYAAKFGVYHEAANYAFPPARRVGCDDQVRLSAQDSAELALRANGQGSAGDAYVRCVLSHLQKYEDTKHRQGHDLYGFTCGATNNMCWITWQGHMTPCAMLDHPYACPIEEGFMPAWERLKHECDQILMSQACSHCDRRAVCTVCPAACHAETGSFEKRSPYHCEMTDYTLMRMRQQVEIWGLEHEIRLKEEEV